MEQKWNAKRIVALAGVILLVLLYVVTLVLAIAGKGVSDMLKICIAGTIVVPFAIWIFIFFYGKMTGKKTMADLHLMEDKEDWDRDIQQEAYDIRVEMAKKAGEAEDRADDSTDESGNADAEDADASDESGDDADAVDGDTNGTKE